MAATTAATHLHTPLHQAALWLWTPCWPVQRRGMSVVARVLAAAKSLPAHRAAPPSHTKQRARARAQVRARGFATRTASSLRVL